jgi:hypothetical protein
MEATEKIPSQVGATSTTQWCCSKWKQQVICSGARGVWSSRTDAVVLQQVDV